MTDTRTYEDLSTDPPEREPGRRIWLPMTFPRSISASNRGSRMSGRRWKTSKRHSRTSSIPSWASTWSISG